MELNNKTVNFSISNADNAEAFSKAIKTLQETETSLNKEFKKGSIPYPDLLRKLIKMVSDFFIEATGEDVIGECNDYAIAQDVYFNFLDAISAQKEKIVSPYSANRFK